MEETYFIICNSDGDTTVTEMTKTELLRAIEENYWGDKGILDTCPRDDTNYWGDNIIIIKGKVVCPEPEQVVTKYKID